MNIYHVLLFAFSTFYVLVVIAQSRRNNRMCEAAIPLFDRYLELRREGDFSKTLQFLAHNQDNGVFLAAVYDYNGRLRSSNESASEESPV